MGHVNHKGCFGGTALRPPHRRPSRLGTLAAQIAISKEPGPVLSCVPLRVRLQIHVVMGACEVRQCPDGPYTVPTSTASSPHTICE